MTDRKPRRWKTFCAIRCAAAVLIMVAAGLAFGDSPKKHFEELVKQDGGIVVSKNKPDGHFVLAVASVSLATKAQNPNQRLETARLIAQRNVAGFLGEAVAVDEERKTVRIKKKILSELGVKIETKYTEEFRANFRATINRTLRAATVLEAREHDGRLYVGVLLSERTIKAAGVLGKVTPLVVPGRELPKEIKGIVALGVAMIVKGNVADARDRALSGAKRLAVEQAFGAMVRASSQLRNLDPATLKGKEFTASFGVVKGFEVLEDGRAGVVCKIRIRATITRRIALADIVKAWQANGAKFHLISGKNPKNPGPDLLDSFGEFFEGLGFRLTKRAADADYEINLRAKHLDKRNPVSGRLLTQLQLTVEIRDPKTGRLLLTKANDPRRAVSDLKDPVRRLQICARKACQQMKAELQDKVGQLAMDMIQNGREIQVVFRGVMNTEGDGYKFAENQIEWMPGIRSFRKTVRPKDREIIYGARYGGDMGALQSALSEALQARFGDASPSVLALSANQLVYAVPQVDAEGNLVKVDKKTARTLASEVLPSVVLLVLFDEKDRPISQGSGFIVRPGIIASNWHVVEKSHRGFAKIPGKEARYRIKKLLISDVDNDLVLLEVDGIKAPQLKLGKADDLAVGDRVYSVGNPKGLEGTFAEGIVSAIRRSPAGRDFILQITAPISPGSSGGPIIDEKGNVIGVAVAQLRAKKIGDAAQLLNFAVPVEYLKTLLSKAAKKPKNPKPPSK